MSVEINNIILSNNLDGYILPKNDNYFTEYSKINNLKSITNFSGSAGFAIFLKNKKYLFVDGRYTIQAEKEVGKNYKICEIPYVWPKDILEKKIKIGFDPDLFTWETLNKYFGYNYNLIPLNFKSVSWTNSIFLNTIDKLYRLLAFKYSPAKKGFTPIIEAI